MKLDSWWGSFCCRKARDGFQLGMGVSVDDQKAVRVEIGIPWTLEEFVAQAILRRLAEET